MATYVSLTKVPLNSGGYDSSGRYWGTGEPLFLLDCPCNLSTGSAHLNAHYIRAANRATAAAKARGHFAHMKLNLDVRS